MYRWLVFAFILTCTIAGFAFESYLDILYYPELEAPLPYKNKLDIFTPDEVSCAVPVVFFVHGGTWMYGDRRDYGLMGELLADEEGLVTVIISYRLSDSLHPETHHPDHITDVAQAFSWTVENIGLYGGNPDKIFVMGHSAGGHLATLLGTNTSYIEAAGTNTTYIQGIISFSMGIYDIPGLYNELGTWAPMVWPYLPFGGIFTDDTLNWYDASPRHHLHDNMPPYVFFVAENDMEHIIGGDVGGMGLVYLDGEVDDVYDDFNEYQPTDTFWIEGDHDNSFANFVFETDSRARVKTMEFIEEQLESVDESIIAQPNSFEVSISPNPFNSAVRIDAPDADHIEILDISGRVIQTTEESFVWTPDNSIASGIYLVRTYFDDSVVTRKVVYQK